MALPPIKYSSPVKRLVKPYPLAPFLAPTTIDSLRSAEHLLQVDYKHLVLLVLYDYLHPVVKHLVKLQSIQNQEGMLD
jgi:hypothetical protein